MKKFKIVEFSDFDGSISDMIQYVLDNKMLYNEPINAVSVQSIALGTQYMPYSEYPEFPYTLAIVVFEVEDDNNE